MRSAQFVEKLQRSVATTGAKFDPGKIPLRECAPRLFGFARPALQVGARRLSFRAVKLIQFGENRRKIDIHRVMLDKVLNKIVARLRRFQLQVRIGHFKKRC